MNLVSSSRGCANSSSCKAALQGPRALRWAVRAVSLGLSGTPPPPAGCSSSSALRVFFSVFLAVLSGFYSHRNFRVNVPNFVEEKNLVGVSIGTVLTL